MKVYLERLKKLRELSGNAQIEYLQQFADDGIMKSILDYTYNPDKMYKIDQGKFTPIKIRKSGLIANVKKNNFNYNDWVGFTNKLTLFSNKRAVKLEEVYMIKEFILNFADEDVQNFLCMVLFKDLRLNMGIKKFQQVWPDFCKVPQLQLAEKFEGKEFENGLYSRKFDGKRMYIRQGKAYSRQNKLCKIEPIRHILNQLYRVSMDYVLDGELLYFDKAGREDFQKAISLSGSDNRVEECDGLYFVVFDMIPIQSFDEQQTPMCFEEEYKMMTLMLGGNKPYGISTSLLKTIYPNVLIARQVSDPSVFEKDSTKNTWEGLMYRNADMPYQFKRTKQLLKIKEMQDGEFRLVGITEGTGRNEQKLGAMNIEYQGNIVGVGSGFSDYEREIIWNNKKLFLNEAFQENYRIKVQYFEETKDADGNPSLRFPVFVCIRETILGEELNVEQFLTRIEEV